MREGEGRVVDAILTVVDAELYSRRGVDAVRGDQHSASVMRAIQRREQWPMQSHQTAAANPATNLIEYFSELRCFWHS